MANHKRTSQVKAKTFKTWFGFSSSTNKPAHESSIPVGEEQISNKANGPSLSLRSMPSDVKSKEEHGLKPSDTNGWRKSLHGLTGIFKGEAHNEVDIPPASAYFPDNAIPTTTPRKFQRTPLRNISWGLSSLRGRHNSPPKLNDVRPLSPAHMADHVASQPIPVIDLEIPHITLENPWTVSEEAKVRCPCSQVMLPKRRLLNAGQNQPKPRDREELDQHEQHSLELQADENLEMQQGELSDLVASIADIKSPTMPQTQNDLISNNDDLSTEELTPKTQVDHPLQADGGLHRSPCRFTLEGSSLEDVSNYSPPYAKQSSSPPKRFLHRLSARKSFDRLKHGILGSRPRSQDSIKSTKATSEPKVHKKTLSPSSVYSSMGPRAGWNEAQRERRVRYEQVIGGGPPTLSDVSSPSLSPLKRTMRRPSADTHMSAMPIASAESLPYQSQIFGPLRYAIEAIDRPSAREIGGSTGARSSLKPGSLKSQGSVRSKPSRRSNTPVSDAGYTSRRPSSTAIFREGWELLEHGLLPPYDVNDPYQAALKAAGLPDERRSKRSYSSVIEALDACASTESLPNREESVSDHCSLKVQGVENLQLTPSVSSSKVTALHASEDTVLSKRESQIFEPRSLSGEADLKEDIVSIVSMIPANPASESRKASRVLREGQGNASASPRSSSQMSTQGKHFGAHFEAMERLKSAKVSGEFEIGDKENLFSNLGTANPSMESHVKAIGTARELVLPKFGDSMRRRRLRQAD